MFRNVALLLLTGCNVVFGLDEVDAMPGVCGPYPTTAPVTFTDVTGATDFSVDATGTHGLVKGVHAGKPARYLAVSATGPDTFAFDAAYDQNLAQLQSVSLPIIAAHMNGAPNHLFVDGSTDPSALADLFATARTSTGDVGAYHYTLRAANGWTLAENAAVDAAPGQDIYPFDDLEEATQAANLFARRVVVVRVDPTSGARTLDLDIRNPSDPSWRAQTAGGGLPIAQQINSAQSVEAGVLAVGTDGDAHPLVLIYSASVGGGATSLYASRGATTGFPLGEPLSVGGGDGDLHEPWATPDCAQLWFRSGSTIYHAQSL